MRTQLSVYSDISCAEIRNRIYDFATERDDYDGWKKAVPLVTYHVGRGKDDTPSQWPMSTWRKYVSARNFFGLTQTCKLIRKEYRPIWLRNSSIRVRLVHLNLYIHTFYGCGTDYSNIPKLIQLSHNHDVHNQDSLDITHLLRMHVASPATKFEFIAEELAEVEGPWSTTYEDCDLCDEDFIGAGTPSDPYPPSDMSLDCPHEEVHRAAYASYLLEDELPYLDALNNLIAHDNPKWLGDIRDGDVTRVKFDTSDMYRECPEITIRFWNGSDVVKTVSKKSMLGAASDYIHTRDLASTATVDVSIHFMVQICGHVHH